MAKKLANVIGDRGEIIFELVLTNYAPFGQPLFQPSFLGDKWPTIDYHVELVGVKESRPVFFVQVKTTAAPLAAKTTKLPISVPKSDRQDLYRFIGPTYIAGVHEPSQRVFLTSVHTKSAKGLFEISLKNELTPKTLQTLYNEVWEFWKAITHKPVHSFFS